MNQYFESLLQCIISETLIIGTEAYNRANAFIDGSDMTNGRLWELCNSFPDSTDLKVRSKALYELIDSDKDIDPNFHEIFYNLKDAHDLIITLKTISSVVASTYVKETTDDLHKRIVLNNGLTHLLNQIDGIMDELNEYGGEIAKHLQGIASIFDDDESDSDDDIDSESKKYEDMKRSLGPDEYICNVIDPLEGESIESMIGLVPPEARKGLWRKEIIKLDSQYKKDYYQKWIDKDTNEIYIYIVYHDGTPTRYVCTKATFMTLYEKMNRV